MMYHLGTSGFSYPEWSGGVFYPPGVKPSEYLAYYSRCFDALELDTTFYAAPDATRIQRWAEQVPDHFRFALKTPRDITHADNLGDVANLMLSFLKPLHLMGPKLGMVLLQFPPIFAASRWRELQKLLQVVPPEIPLAAEFRHYSWWQAPATARLLEDYQTTWASADYVGSPRELRTTAGKIYLRLIGEHDRFPLMNKELLDPTEDLKRWKSQIEASGARETWILFNNDYAGHAPATLDRYKQLLGQEIRRPLAVETTLFG